MKYDKQFILNSIAQLLGFLINFAIGFFLTPIIVKSLGGEAYGFVGLANSFINIIQIITVSINSMAGRFITISIHQKKYTETKEYFSSVFFSNAILSILLTIPVVVTIYYLELFLDVSTMILIDVKFMWFLIYGSFILNLMGAVYSTIMFANNRLELSAIRDIFSYITKGLILTILFSFLLPSLWYVGLASLVSSFTLLFFNIYFSNKLQPSLKVKIKYFKYEKVKELISSGIWNSFNKMALVMSSGLSLLLANKFVDAQAMGVLAISKVIPNISLAAFGMLAALFAPKFTIYYAKKQFDDLTAHIKSSITYLGFFTSIFISVLVAYGYDFYTLWVPYENHSLLNILTLITILSYSFSLPLESLWNVFTVTNKVKIASIYVFFSSLFSLLVTLILIDLVNSSLYILYVIVGVQSVFTVVNSVIFLPIFASKSLNMKSPFFFYKVIINTLIKIFITLVVSILVKVHFKISGSWELLIIGILISTLFAILINFLYIKFFEKNIYSEAEL